MIAASSESTWKAVAVFNTYSNVKSLRISAGMLQRAYSHHKHFHRIRSTRPKFQLHASVQHQPCIAFTNTCGDDSALLRQLATEARYQFQCEAVVLQPVPQQHSSNSAAAAAAAGGAACYSWDKELHLLPQAEHGNYLLAGASAADCVLCAADQKAGLLQSLGLAPVLVVIGVHRGPALASDVETNPAVVAARQAAQLGLPSIASCLATPSATAPMQPAVQATLHLLHQVVACLKAGRDSWPAAANMPRAHFPFPEVGRWALGKELPLPQQASSSDAHWQATDCWALGEDNSWAGRYASKQSPTQPSRHRSDVEAGHILRRAFRDGDIFLCLNVPPTWSCQAGSISPGFASTRPGVLWHCHQVEAHSAAADKDVGQIQSTDQEVAAGSSRTSWYRQEQDVFGRSLPSSNFSSGQSVVTGAFVAQDNTHKIIAAASSRQQHQQHQRPGVPASFVIRRGTLLNDHATAGDVEAVFSGRAAVSALQTWPAGHPLSLRDDALVSALNEDPSTGLPAWLSSQA